MKKLLALIFLAISTLVYADSECGDQPFVICKDGYKFYKKSCEMHWTWAKGNPEPFPKYEPLYNGNQLIPCKNDVNTVEK